MSVDSEHHILLTTLVNLLLSTGIYSTLLDMLLLFINLSKRPQVKGFGS